MPLRSFSAINRTPRPLTHLDSAYWDDDSYEPTSRQCIDCGEPLHPTALGTICTTCRDIQDAEAESRFEEWENAWSDRRIQFILANRPPGLEYHHPQDIISLLEDGIITPRGQFICIVPGCPTTVVHHTKQFCHPHALEFHPDDKLVPCATCSNLTSKANVICEGCTSLFDHCFLPPHPSIDEADRHWKRDHADKRVFNRKTANKGLHRCIVKKRRR